MTEYSTYDFITVEDYNTILAKYGAYYNDVYAVDIMKLNHLYYQGERSYDFLRLFQNNEYFTINVENSLWTGEIKILECTMTEGFGTRPNIRQYGDMGFRILMTAVESLTIGLVMSNRTSFHFDVNELRTVGVRDLNVPYLIAPSCTVQVVDAENNPVSNADVTIFRTDNWMMVDWTHTDNEGYCTFELLSMDKPCTFMYEILASTGINNNVYDYFKVNYSRVSIAPVLLNNCLYSDSVNQITLEFLLDDTMADYSGLFEGNNIMVYANNKACTSTLYGEGDVYYESTVDLTNYTNDTVNIKIVSTGNEYIAPFTVEYELPVVEYEVYNFSELQSAPSEGETLTVHIKDNINFTDTVHVPADSVIKIIDDTANGHMVTGNIDVLFDVHGKLTLQDFNMSDVTGCIISQNPDSTVNLTDCDFYDIYPDAPEHNSILYCCTDADSVSDSSLFKTVITSCVFVNCPSCIFHSGECSINNSVFDMSPVPEWFNSENEYIFTDYPFGVYQQYGSLHIHQTSIKLDFEDIIVNNLTYGHLFTYLGTKVSVNNTTAKNLTSKNTFPLTDNTSTIRIKYKNNNTITQIVPELNFTTQSILWTIEDTNKLYDNHALILTNED